MVENDQKQKQYKQKRTNHIAPPHVTTSNYHYGGRTHGCDLFVPGLKWSWNGGTY